MLWWLLGVVGLVVSGWGVVSTYRTLHPKPRPFPAPHALPVVRTVRVVSHEGKVFELWVFESRTPRGVILACHGYHANRLQLVELAERFCQRGYTVVIFDLRGHGTRRGPCTFGVYDVQDLGVILRWLHGQPDLDQLPLGMFGLSLGGAIACQAVTRYPELRALAVDSTYARLFPIVAQAIRKQYHLPAMPWAWITWACVQLVLRRRLSRLDPVVLAVGIQRPLLLIHGTEDQSVPVDHARALYARWQGYKEQWIKAGVGHVGMYAHDPEGYCERIISFFDRWLRPL